MKKIKKGNTQRWVVVKTKKLKGGVPCLKN